MGCRGCATVFHTGGIEDIDEMAERLTKEGKVVTGKIGLPFALFACYLPMSSMFLKEHKKEIEECDAMLMQSCGDGAKVVRAYLEEEMGIVKPMYRVEVLLVIERSVRRVENANLGEWRAFVRLCSVLRDC